MKLLAIDPGNEKSAYVVYDTETKAVLEFEKTTNDLMLTLVKDSASYPLYIDLMAIEMPACYGMAVGATVFNTCRWVGIFQQAFGVKKTYLVYRKSKNEESGIDSVTMHLCKSTRAKDTNVRRAILDRYPATGGGKTPQVGTKKEQGPLYGISTDVWSALAVAITFAETLNISIK